MKELLAIVDENNNLTTEVAEREDVHIKGLWHREVKIWVVNELGEILVQKGSPNKKQNPNKWGICAGHIDAGESVETTIIRELKEEIGLNTVIDDLEFMFISKEQNNFPNGTKNNIFFYAYFIKTDFKIEDYKIQTEELTALKYISFEELKKVFKTQSPEYSFSNLNCANQVLEELEKRI